MGEDELYEDELVDIGWICPRCDSCISPDVDICPVCYGDNAVKAIHTIYIN